MANVLIIDDDQTMSAMLSDVVAGLGHHVKVCHTLTSGLKKVRMEPFDVVLLDVWLPDGNGLDALPHIQGATASPEVIIITAEGDADGAEAAIKNGAWDYIEKTASLSDITLPLMRALQYREARIEAKSAKTLRMDGIVGRSAALKSAFDLVAKAASNDTNVLITGETGTGKELFAWAIHNNSSRAHRNFVVVDCASLPSTLVESVLFGHVKGAFTGADRSQDGLIRQADGGTLFLDEVGELPLSMQKAFLRVLENHRFRPVGSKLEVGSNFRLIAATNKKLHDMAQKKEFREDLLYRLQAMTMEIPPLRERSEDIEELITYYNIYLCRNYGIETKGISLEFMEVLNSYDWPGNVRELLHTLERALAVARHEPVLHPKHLSNHIRAHVAKQNVLKVKEKRGQKNNGVVKPGFLDKLKNIRESALSQVEKQYLLDLMLSTGGNIKESCRISGLSRPRLYALMSKYKVGRSLGRESAEMNKR